MRKNRILLKTLSIILIGVFGFRVFFGTSSLILGIYEHGWVFLRYSILDVLITFALGGVGFYLWDLARAKKGEG